MKKRVKIPMRDAKSLIDLAKKVRDKHVADGDGSPLKILNWAEVSQLIEDTIATDDKAMQLKREKLSAFQHREQKLEELLGMVRNSRDILSGVFSKELKSLGHWGFDVLDNRTVTSTDTPPAPATPTAKPEPVAAVKTT